MFYCFLFDVFFRCGIDDYLLYEDVGGVDVVRVEVIDFYDFFYFGYCDFVVSCG